MASVELQLGKREVKDDHRTLMASDYMGDVSPPPEQVDWLSVVPAWEMYANNRIGDCTVATAGHMIVQWVAAGTYQAIDLTDERVTPAEVVDEVVSDTAEAPKSAEEKAAEQASAPHKV